ncbi:hypothetical protein [[Clostridium] fimetarium]|uniref:Uncharacterized protein n=1 Tax=[Clostridium] fimetarium TaxID=99656 RepID=A0A1I0RTQ8_9FIRM|nr:hypothetical protein [[Clostridium] fimetarium]SEW44807.1 hypothetical protein SAMN05421659_12324 [[Clostridium] fimetarium]
MRINQKALAFIIIIILFGTIFTTTALGVWKTTNTKIPEKYKSGDFQDEYNPQDIKGSYTFGEISELFNIPIVDLAVAFAIEDRENISSIQCKELETIYETTNLSGKEIGTDSVRIFVSLYRGLPITLNDTTYFPNQLESILLKAGNMTEQQKIFISTHLIKSESNTEVLETTTTTYASEHAEFIKGTTTFNEILDLGIKKEDIEEVMNNAITDTSVVIKDFCIEKGMEFSNTKSQIQSLIDKK